MLFFFKQQYNLIINNFFQDSFIIKCSISCLNRDFSTFALRSSPPLLAYFVSVLLHKAVYLISSWSFSHLLSHWPSGGPVTSFKTLQDVGKVPGWLLSHSRIGLDVTESYRHEVILEGKLVKCLTLLVKAWPLDSLIADREIQSWNFLFNRTQTYSKLTVSFTGGCPKKTSPGDQLSVYSWLYHVSISLPWAHREAVPVSDISIALIWAKSWK